MCNSATALLQPDPVVIRAECMMPCHSTWCCPCQWLHPPCLQHTTQPSPHKPCADTTRQSTTCNTLIDQHTKIGCTVAGTVCTPVGWQRGSSTGWQHMPQVTPHNTQHSPGSGSCRKQHGITQRVSQAAQNHSVDGEPEHHQGQAGSCRLSRQHNK